MISGIVDIDGVIFDTDSELRSIGKYLYNIDAPNVTDTWNYYNYYTNEQFKEILNLFWRFKLLSLNLVPGAKKGFEFLSSHSDVFIVTSRPDFTKEDTENSLSLEGFGIHDVMFSDSKHKVGQRESVDYIIEDRLSTAVRFAEDGIHAFLIDYPYNRIEHNGSLPFLHRCKDWKEVCHKFQEVFGVKHV